MKSDKELNSVFINSVPKCGTHLLNQIIRGIPTFKNAKWLWLLQHQDYIKKMENVESVTVMLGHVHYSDELRDYLDKHKIPRLFIYRDPRDMIVSYVYYVMNIADGHELKDYFTEELTCNEERIMKLITGFNLEEKSLRYNDIRYHYYPFMPWKDDSNTFVLRYEDLIESTASRKQTLNKVVDYMWDSLQYTGINKEAIVQAMEKNINPQKSDTFRKGKIGDWKNHFTEKNIEIFKSIAGEFIVELGYEKDQYW